MLIDTHAHLNFRAFDEDRDEVIKRSLENDTWLINVSSNYGTSKLAVEIAEKYGRGVYAAIGLHPINIKQEILNRDDDSEDALEEDFDGQKYKGLAKSPKVIAIGEIGLDYWSKPKTKRKLEIFKQKQKEIFLKQLDLARGLSLPVILHCRLAHDNLIQMLENYAAVQKLHLEGMVHCFTGTWEQAEKYLAMGFYLGVNGIIFRLDLDETIKKVPLNRILIETDCPFLLPSVSVNQCKSAIVRNEPIYVKYVAQRIAEIKGEPFEKIAEITTQNAKNLFDIVSNHLKR